MLPLRKCIRTPLRKRHFNDRTANTDFATVLRIGQRAGFYFTLIGEASFVGETRRRLGLLIGDDFELHIARNMLNHNFLRRARPGLLTVATTQLGVNADAEGTKEFQRPCHYFRGDIIPIRIFFGQGDGSIRTEKAQNYRALFRRPLGLAPRPFEFFL